APEPGRDRRQASTGRPVSCRVIAAYQGTELLMLPLSTGKLSWRNFPKGSRSTCRSPTWNRYRARGALAAQRGMVGDDGAGTGRDLGETAVADQRQRQVSGEQRSPAVRGRGADRQGEV